MRKQLLNIVLRICNTCENNEKKGKLGIIRLDLSARVSVKCIGKRWVCSQFLLENQKHIFIHVTYQKQV